MAIAAVFILRSLERVHLGVRALQRGSGHLWVAKDSQDKDGGTTLHCAAERGHADCVELLLKAGTRLQQQLYAVGVPFTCGEVEWRPTNMALCILVGASAGRPGGAPLRFSLGRSSQMSLSSPHKREIISWLIQNQPDLGTSIRIYQH